MARSNTARVSQVLAAAVTRGVLSEDAPLAMFYDLGAFRAGIAALQAAFPPGTLHTLAVKANPLAALLREARAAGMGAECASRGEFEHALRLGFPSDTIVFDSPAKTEREIALAVEHGVYINVDNFQELERLRRIGERGLPLRAGIRINPQIGAGTVSDTSTATATSKFGVPLAENRAALLEAYRDLPWLVGLHVHVGSIGCSLELLTEGVRATVELAQEIERYAGRSLAVLDIGGGLPVDVAAEGPPPFARYAALLRERVPDVFRYRLVTEFGRSLNARVGWVASRVEYTKTAGGRPIAVIHAGGDLFVRAIYVPHWWTYRLTVHHPDGTLKEGPLVEQDVVGPLCFAGDRMATGRELPRIEPGDIVVVHDAGAYTLSVWSHYNSRHAPPVYGYCSDPDLKSGLGLELLKPGETTDDVLRFWGGPPEA